MAGPSPGHEEVHTPCRQSHCQAQVQGPPRTLCASLSLLVWALAGTGQSTPDPTLSCISLSVTSGWSKSNCLRPLTSSMGHQGSSMPPGHRQDTGISTPAPPQPVMDCVHRSMGPRAKQPRSAALSPSCAAETAAHSSRGSALLISEQMTGETEHMGPKSPAFWESDTAFPRRGEGPGSCAPLPLCSSKGHRLPWRAWGRSPLSGGH